MKKLVALLNRKPYLRFFASVELAIPLLLVLAAVVATGTIIESRYNTEYARILIYDSYWFHGLLGLLWINIFLAALSRYPFQRRHIGFIIVHTGLLTLLVGGFMTSMYGVDGQLRVAEGSQGNTVVLNDMTLELIDVQANSALRVAFSRGSSRLSGSSLDFLNSRFHSKILAREFLPFAEVKDSFAGNENNEAGPIAVGFMLKSQFFDVSEWLHSADRPEMTMGPATVRLVVDKSEPKTVSTIPPSHKKTPPHASGGARLVVRNISSNEIVKEFAIKNLQAGLELKAGVILNSFKIYKHATVSDNHLVEGDGSSSNPAIELSIKSGTKVVREVAYSNFPNFSLSQGSDGDFGLRFDYQIAGDAARTVSSDEESSEAGMEESSQGSREGNVIEFHTFPGSGDKVRVELYKNDQQVMTQTLSPGEGVTTPWMGMRLTLGSVKHGAQAETQIAETPVQPRSDLPPPAIYITPAGVPPDKGFWLADGQFRRVTIMGREYEVFFGHQTVELPFSLNLVEFKKTDYPGTETPMSFQSRVKVNNREPDITVSMNEPLKYDGYTLYQSSFDIRPGQPRASIFSVNRDPGRPVKYIGSLILAIGIITFTLMRSRVYQNYVKQRHANG